MLRGDFMKAYKCDRCGKYFERDVRDEDGDRVPYYAIKMKNTEMTIPLIYHICPKCGDSLTEWYYEKKEKPSSEKGEGSTTGFCNSIISVLDDLEQAIEKYPSCIKRSDNDNHIFLDFTSLEPNDNNTIPFGERYNITKIFSMIRSALENIKED